MSENGWLKKGFRNMSILNVVMLVVVVGGVLLGTIKYGAEAIEIKKTTVTLTEEMEDVKKCIDTVGQNQNHIIDNNTEMKKTVDIMDKKFDLILMRYYGDYWKEMLKDTLQ